jgi:hypothetical protein
VPGYPGHDQPIQFRAKSAGSDGFHFQLALSTSATSSAVRIRHPQHLLRLGTLSAGRLSTSELVGAWGITPMSNVILLSVNASIFLCAENAKKSVLFNTIFCVEMFT